MKFEDYGLPTHPIGRQRFLDEAHYDSHLQSLSDSIASDRQAIQDGELSQSALGRFRRDVAHNALNQMILRYTGGTRSLSWKRSSPASFNRSTSSRVTLVRTAQRSRSPSHGFLNRRRSSCW